MATPSRRPQAGFSWALERRVGCWSELVDLIYEGPHSEGGRVVAGGGVERLVMPSMVRWGYRKRPIYSPSHMFCVKQGGAVSIGTFHFTSHKRLH